MVLLTAVVQWTSAGRPYHNPIVNPRPLLVGQWSLPCLCQVSPLLSAGQRMQLPHDAWEETASPLFLLCRKSRWHKLHVAAAACTVAMVR